MNQEIKPYTGKRILMWFIGFFLVVFTVNGIMTYFALNTWTGLETENSYVKGLNYNNEIENARAQLESGWNISIPNKPKNKNDRFEITLERPDESLPPSEISVQFIRAVVQGYDQEIQLIHNGDGVYSNQMNLPLPGQWDVLVVVKSQNNLIFRLKDHIIVK